MHGVAIALSGKRSLLYFQFHFYWWDVWLFVWWQREFAAKVNGETISQQDFLNRYNQEFEARAQQEGESFLAKTDSVEFVTALRQNLIQRFSGSRINPSICERIKIRCK